MKYSYLNTCDLVNGKGIRVSIFVSGCEHHCKGCFNKDTWDKESGEEYTKEVEDKIIEALRSKHIEGISILGGDPLAVYNRDPIYLLCKRIKKELPDKTIYIWTGYSADYVRENLWTFTQVSDMIITEKFVESEKRKIGDSEEEFYLRGSKNQKFIINGKIFDNLPTGYKLKF